MMHVKSKMAFRCQISRISAIAQPPRPARAAQGVPAFAPQTHKYRTEDRMKPSLAAGLTATTRVTVDRDRTIDFMGEKARVYATPMLVRDIEMACRALLLEHLDAGEDSVGTRIEVDHLAATLLGMTVDLTVSVVDVKGRAVTLEVSGSDGIDAICRGKHNRFVVDVKTTEARLMAKRQKAGLL
jgi:fluoroacetyl-CoA thioesterase